MKISEVHPQLRNGISRIPAMPYHNPIALALFKLLLKALPNRKSMFGVSIVEQQLANASVRIYRPEGELSGAGLLWIHGGGLIVGSALMDDSVCVQYANDLKLVVVSVEYRLAPQHPFPAAIDDCFAAWQWFQNTAYDLGVAPERIVIAGQSAGGGLTACLAQRIFDAGGAQPAGQALFCPMLDDRTAARYELDAIKHRIWNNKNNRGGWSMYLGHAPGKAEEPQYIAAARRKDFSGLPPAWIGIGDIELFYDEACAYADRLKAAGVSCELEVVPGAPHGFEIFCAEAPVTRDYLASCNRFLRKVLKL